MPAVNDITIREIINFDTAVSTKDYSYPRFYCGYTDKLFIRFVFYAEHPTSEQVLIDEVRF